VAWELRWAHTKTHTHTQPQKHTLTTAHAHKQTRTSVGQDSASAGRLCCHHQVWSIHLKMLAAAGAPALRVCSRLHAALLTGRALRVSAERGPRREWHSKPGPMRAYMHVWGQRHQRMYSKASVMIQGASASVIMREHCSIRSRANKCWTTLTLTRTLTRPRTQNLDLGLSEGW